MRSRLLRIVANNSALSRDLSGSVLLKGFAVIIGFFSTPAYINFFADQPVLGAWFTILSILNWIAVFDFGIGNGLRNRLVRPLIDENYAEVRLQVSSAYAMLGGMSVMALIAGWFVIGGVDWNALFGIPETTLTIFELVSAMRITFAGIVLVFWLRTIVSVLYAMQRASGANLAGAITSTLVLFFLVFGGQGDAASDLLRLAWVNLAASALPLIALTVWVYFTSLRHARPSIRCFDGKVARDILRIGSSFFGIQLGLLVVNSTNPWLISLRPPEVVPG